jgi:hypothetical protein
VRIAAAGEAAAASGASASTEAETAATPVVAVNVRQVRMDIGI